MTDKYTIDDLPFVVGCAHCHDTYARENDILKLMNEAYEAGYKQAHKDIPILTTGIHYTNEQQEKIIKNLEKECKDLKYIIAGRHK